MSSYDPMDALNLDAAAVAQDGLRAAVQALRDIPMEVTAPRESRALMSWLMLDGSPRAERWERKRLTRGMRTSGLLRALEDILDAGRLITCDGCVHKKAKRFSNDHSHRRAVIGSWIAERLSSDKTTVCYAALRDGAEGQGDPSMVLEIGPDAYVCGPASRMLPGFGAKAEAALEDLERNTSFRMGEILAHVESVIGGLSDGSVGAPPNAPVLSAIYDRRADGVSANWRDAFEVEDIDDIVGQRTAVERLANNFKSPYPRHVLAFGPPGCGKSSTVHATISAAMGAATSRLTSTSPVIEVDASTAYQTRALNENTFTGGTVPWQFERNVGRRNHERRIPMISVGALSKAHGGALIISNFDHMPPDMLPPLFNAMDSLRIPSQSLDFDAANPHMTPAERDFLVNGMPADCLVIGICEKNPADGAGDGKAWLAAERRAFAESRFMVIEFQPLEPASILGILERGSRRLGIEAHPAVLGHIARCAAGDARRACSMFLEVAGGAAVREGRVGAMVMPVDAFNLPGFIDQQMRGD